jgi:hypothetical protein
LNGTPAEDGTADAGRTGLLVLLFLVLPLFVLPACRDAFSVPKTALLVVAVAVMGLAWTWSVVTAGQLPRRRTPLNLPVALLLATAAAAWFASGHLYLGARALSPVVACALLFCIVRDAGPRATRWLLWAAVAAGAGVAAVVIAEFLGWPLFAWAPEPDPRRRIVSTLGNAQFAACYLAAVPVLALGLTLRAGRVRRAAGLAVAALAAAALLLTGMRLAWLAAALGLTLFAGLCGAARGRRGVRRLCLGAAVALALCVPVGLLLWGSRGVGERARTWRVALSMARRHPFLGTGHGAGSATVDAAHNEYLQWLAETGVAGAVAALWLAAATLYACVRVQRAAGETERPLAAGLVAGVVVLAALGAGHFPFRVVPVAALAVLLVGSLAARCPSAAAGALLSAAGTRRDAA